MKKIRPDDYTTKYGAGGTPRPVTPPPQAPPKAPQPKSPPPATPPREPKTGK